MALGLRSQILAAPLLLTALAFGVLGTTAYRFVADLLVAGEDRAIRQEIRHAERFLSDTAERLADRARELADHSDLWSHVGPGTADHSPVADLLPWKVRWGLDWLDLVDREGRERLSLDDRENPLTGFTTPPPVEPEEERVVRLGLAGITLATVLRTGDETRLVGAAPIRRPTDGEIVGVLLLGQRVDRELLRDLETQIGSRVALLGPDGRPLTPGAGLPVDCGTCHGRAEAAKSPAFHSTFVAIPTRSPLLPGSRRLGMARIAVAGEPLGLLVVERNLGPALTDLRRATGAMALVALGFSLAGILALARAVRWIVGPVKALADATRRCAEGDLTAEVPVRGAAEIRELAEAFNAMTRQLAGAREEQTALQRELERRVRERTRELEEAVERLITVRELGRHLPHAGDPEAVLRAAARLGAEAVRARGACVLVRSGSSPGAWVLAGAFGRVDPAGTEIRFGPELPLADLATPRGAVVDAGPGEAVADPVSGRPVRSLLAAPVQAPDAHRPEALLVVYDAEGRPAFDRRDLDVLLPFAREVGAVYAAARLHRLQQKATLEIVESLVNAIEAKDPYTRGHSQRVTRLALAVGRELEIPDRAAEVLEQAAMLHDIGKIALRHEVLRKPARLEPVELDLVRQHPLTGAKILEPLSWLREVAEVVLQHHERPDGTGYPMGIGGSHLRLEARILAAADAYDAMTSDRPYRAGMGPAEALAELRRGAGTQFDPVVVEALESVLRREHPEIGAGAGSG